MTRFWAHLMCVCMYTYFWAYISLGVLSIFIFAVSECAQTKKKIWSDRRKLGVYTHILYIIIMFITYVSFYCIQVLIANACKPWHIHVVSYGSQENYWLICDWKIVLLWMFFSHLLLLIKGRLGCRYVCWARNMT